MLSIPCVLCVSTKAWNCWEKGKADPIESNWSWTKHLIFLLWKIQCYLDGNKAGGKAFSSICGSACDTKATHCPRCLPVLSCCLSLFHHFKNWYLWSGNWISCLVLWISLIFQELKPDLMRPRVIKPLTFTLCPMFSTTSSQIPHFHSSPVIYLNTSQQKHTIKCELHIICQDWTWKGTALGKIWSRLPLPLSPFFSVSFLLAASVDLMSVPDVNTDWIYY